MRNNIHAASAAGAVTVAPVVFALKLFDVYCIVAVLVLCLVSQTTRKARRERRTLTGTAMGPRAISERVTCGVMPELLLIGPFVQ